MMVETFLFEATRFLSRHVGRAASSDSFKPSHCAFHFCALSRYRVIREDRFIRNWKNNDL
jgi:hypothetical protein